MWDTSLQDPIPFRLARCSYLVAVASGPAVARAVPVLAVPERAVLAWAALAWAALARAVRESAVRESAVRESAVQESAVPELGEASVWVAKAVERVEAQARDLEPEAAVAAVLPPGSPAFERRSGRFLQCD